ncbi:MAG: hypothetical protein JWP97_4861 [Labilithrix sp.]|nr:hypothetical protein [Labilithrix sp.]
MSRRVLIADDSPVARISVARLVRAEGLEVEERESVLDASSVDASELACALLDLELGDGLGTEVAERLRDVASELPIAFFTSEREGGALARARAFGPVFAKPGELDLAVDWIRRNR